MYRKLFILWALLLASHFALASSAETFSNPIISGTWADPGFIRVGSDYYSVCSTQGWQPGAHIIHSKDLLNWEYIGYGYREHSEIPPGLTYRGGWGLEMGYNPNNQTFLIYAPMSDGNLYAYYSKDPAGPYESKPMGRLGTDPGFFVDDDNKVYLICSEKAVIWEMTSDGLSIKRKVCRIKKKDIPIFEGPGLFKHGRYYYLLYSAYGTGAYDGGLIGTMRARDLAGPWERDPDNPQLLTDPNAAIQGPQHGTLVETQNGQWYLAYHAHELSHYSLARQMYLEQIEWTDDGWWRCVNGKVPSRDVARPDLAEHKVILRQSDEFDSPELSLQWFFLTKPDFSGESWSLTDRPGYLRIRTGTGDIGSIESQPCVFLQRVMNKYFEFSTEVTFDAGQDGHAAGLHMFHDPKMNFWLATTIRNGNTTIEVGKYNDGKRTELYSTENTIGDKVYLKIAVDGSEHASFYYSGDGSNWKRLGDTIYFGDSFADFRNGEKGDPDLGWASVGKKNRWTGTTFGVFATGGQAEPTNAYFDYIRVNQFDAETVRILCFGDSITQGVGAVSQGGFRGPLKELLTDAGIRTDFIGSVGHTGTPPTITDPEHESDSGRRISRVTRDYVR